MRTNEYTTWQQLTGYFDGDGSILIGRIRGGIPFTLNVRLHFSDQSRTQIEMVSRFLISQGVKTGSIGLRVGAWRVEVASLAGVRRMLEQMYEHSCKKHHEIRAVLDYLSDGITGDRLQDILEEAVRRGDREKVGSRADLPWTRGQGLKRANEYAFSFAGRKPPLEPEVVGQILADSSSGLSRRRIAKLRGVSYSRVKKILAQSRVRAPS